MDKPNEQDKYIFIDKALFFPKEGIVVFGDLHLGYEEMMKQEGLSFPVNQVEQTIEDMQKIFEEIKSKGFKVKKIILIGDVKHYFAFYKPEIYDVREVLHFLERYAPKENIILIKGNHDTFSLANKELERYHVEGDIAFTHGNELYPPILDKKINYIVIGHFHPSVAISEKRGVKREKFKCFLTGKWKGKEVVILPSFLSAVEGTDVREYNNYCFITNSELKKFGLYVLSDTGEIYKFGKVKDLD